MLTVTEEVLLLLLDTDKGEIRFGQSDQIRNFIFAGAVLTDLALENRIDTDLKQLFVTDPSPVGDNLLDPILNEVVQEKSVHDSAYWILRISKHGDDIQQKVLTRLSKYGILEHESNGLVFLTQLVSRTRRYPLFGSKAAKEVQVRTEEVQFRVMRILFSDDVPEPRDIVIISLVAACGLFKHILSVDELEEVQKRIDQISRLDLIGRTVTQTISGFDFSPDSSQKSVRSLKEIPKVVGWPIAGSAFGLIKDVGGFLMREYQKHGSVFQFKVFNQNYIALVSPEINTFVTKKGANHLRTCDFWQDFNAYTKSKHVIISMDGVEHLRMRKVLARHYSPIQILENMNKFHTITQNVLSAWPENQPITVYPEFQKLVAEQVGQMVTNVSPKEYIDDIILFLDTLLATQLFKQQPKLILRNRRFRHAESRVKEFFETILADYNSESRESNTRHFVDDLLELNRKEPQFFPETDFLMAFLGPYFAGIHTSPATISYIIYEILKHPELVTAIRAETDGLFNRDTLSAKDFRKLEVTRQIIQETHRKYPVVPLIRRMVSNSFEFDGYKIPAGEFVMIGSAITHNLPEYFENPESFDLNRFTDRSRPYKQAGVFNPYGVGRHRCLASSFSELQIAFTIAILVQNYHVELVNPNLPLKIVYKPVYQPSSTHQIRISRRQRQSH